MPICYRERDRRCGISLWSGRWMVNDEIIAEDGAMTKRSDDAPSALGQCRY